MDHNRMSIIIRAIILNDSTMIYLNAMYHKSRNTVFADLFFYSLTGAKNRPFEFKFKKIRRMFRLSIILGRVFFFCSLVSRVKLFLLFFSTLHITNWIKPKQKFLPKWVTLPHSFTCRRKKKKTVIIPEIYKKNIYIGLTKRILLYETK